MDIKPIKNDEDLAAALHRIDQLMDTTDRALADELDVLVTLVEAYEDVHYPIGQPDPISAIKFQMEQKPYTQTDLALLLGSRSRATEILNGKRPLTLRMIRTLHTEWGIPLESLVQPQPQKKARRAEKTRKQTRKAS